MSLADLFGALAIMALVIVGLFLFFKKAGKK